MLNIIQSALLGFVLALNGIDYKNFSFWIVVAIMSIQIYKESK